MNTIYAKKIGMTEAYIGDTRRSVTILQVLPLTVTHHKTVEKDGYAKTQVAIGTSAKKPNKALAGHLKKAKVVGQYLREIDVLETQEIGATLSLDALTVAGTVVDLTGTSKGKGIAGVVKRWNFAGGPRTHGQSDRLRRAGSIGQGTTPGRVYKGKKMSGRMGNDAVTIKNTFIVAYNPDTSYLYVAGSAPGSVGSLVKLVKRSDAPATFPKITLTKTHVITPKSEPATESETV